MRSINTLALVWSLLLGAGCASNPPQYTTAPVFQEDLIPAPPPPTEAATPAAAAETVATPVYQANRVPPVAATTDQDLVTSVRHQFDRYGDLSGMTPNIDITAYDGNVTLTGSVPGERERQMILAMVKNTPGVVTVNDQLRVADLAPTGRAEESKRVYTEMPDNYFNLHLQGLSETDRQLAQQILQDLRTEGGVAATVPKVNIYVAGGKVTLRGMVQNEQERQTIATRVQNAVGAENVLNELQVQQPAR